jgi:peptidylprolyl isomerase
MKRWWPLAVLAALPAAAYAQGDEVIAAFGAVEMRLSEMRRLLAAQPPLVREQLAESPPALERLARAEVFRRALAAEARAKGWDKRPEAIERMERAREQALVSSYMDSLARPAADFPSEKELREAYDANRGELTVPRQYRVARIRDGAAEELGWLAENQLLPEVARALAALKPGEASAPIQTATGAHVVKLHERREAAPRPFEEVRGELAAALRLRRAQENEQRHFDEMLKKYPLAVNEIALNRLKNELAKTR